MLGRAELCHPLGKKEPARYGLADGLKSVYGARMAGTNHVSLKQFEGAGPRGATGAKDGAGRAVVDVHGAVTRARAAQARWRLTPFEERVALLRRAAKRMLERRADVVALAHEEGGKVDAEGIFNEALGPLDTISSWARIVRPASRRQSIFLNPISFPKKRAFVDLVPRGVVGIIAPWNYPVAGLYRSTVPALLTGNAIVVKPSEYTPRTSGWYLDRLAETLPEGVVQVVQGDGRVGVSLIDAGIDACVFTGSPETGRKVRLQCAQRGVVASVEMGGKDPAIVLADCDLPRAIAGITHWSLSNAGQACGAIEIAYVDAQIADSFVRHLAAVWKRLRVGTDPKADVGPLSNPRQFDVVVAHVADAIAKGATVVCGGGPTGDGLSFMPTILDHCNDEMSVVRDETFGPVLAIVRVEGAAEAVRHANRGRYGLGASIWTRDISRAERLAERLNVGVVTINNHALSGAIPALPWSGTRDTGSGIANSSHSLGTFVRPRATIVDTASAPELYWMPYDDTLRELGGLLADAQIGRIAGAWRIPFQLRKRMKSLRAFFGMDR